MANDRGQYGNNTLLVGHDPRTTYVGGEHSSIGKWLLGAVAIGGGILFMRHQSRQIEQLYKTGGMPYQSFGGSLRESARELPTRARQAYRGLVGRVRSPKAAASLPAPASEPAHSVRLRSGR